MKPGQVWFHQVVGGIKICEKLVSSVTTNHYDTNLIPTADCVVSHPPPLSDFNQNFASFSARHQSAGGTVMHRKQNWMAGCLHSLVLSKHQVQLCNCSIVHADIPACKQAPVAMYVQLCNCSSNKQCLSDEEVEQYFLQPDDRRGSVCVFIPLGSDPNREGTTIGNRHK